MNDQTDLYPPNFLHGFYAWIDRLPIPAWFFYLLFAMVLFAGETVLNWSQGTYPFGNFYAFHFVFASQAPFVLGASHYILRVAARAMTSFRPAFHGTAEEYARDQYRLTHLKRGKTILAGLLGALGAPIILLNDSHTFALLLLFEMPLSRTINLAYNVVVYFFIGIAIYQVLHQLRCVNEIYQHHTNIQLLRLGPLYAFSGLTARTALLLPVFNIAWLLALPPLISSSLTTLFHVPSALLGGAVFILPLLGIHKRIADEKERWLDESATRMEIVLAELHRCIDARELEGMDDLQNAIASLEIEQRTLEKIPTWPWQPETFRLIITALLLPIVLFVIQFLVQKFLAP